MENILSHYGVDWCAIALSLYSAYLLGNKEKFGFILFAASNILWIILGVFFMSSYGMALGNFIFFLINIRGYLNWCKEDNETNVAYIKTEESS